MDNPLNYSAELRDPRIERNRERFLEEILMIAIAAVLSGAKSWNEISDYGNFKLEWLKTSLTLPFGIPPHDTFNRVFTALDLEEMEKGLRQLGLVDRQGRQCRGPCASRVSGSKGPRARVRNPQFDHQALDRRGAIEQRNSPATGNRK